LFTKTAVFVNTRQTAEKVYKSLQNRLRKTIGILNSWSVELNDFASVEDFKNDDDARVLIAINEGSESIDLHGIPFLLHFEPPADKETFIGRIVKSTLDSNEETLGIAFTTDLELVAIRKIEQAIGQKIPVAELPEELLIEKEKKNVETEKQPSKRSSTEPVAGEAFHQKKASNSKTYNYSSGLKAKMNNKRKH
jgi:ATP-dependent RNA helicase RhlE